MFLLTPAVIQQEEPSVLRSLISFFPRSDAASTPVATFDGTYSLINNTLSSSSANNTSDATYPFALAFDNISNELYVADYDNIADLAGGTTGSLYISVLAEPSNQLIDAINVTLPPSLDVARPYNPDSLAFDPTNGLMYVAYSSGGYVTAINSTTNTVADFISTGQNAFGFVAFDSENGFLYQYSSNGFLTKINTTSSSEVLSTNVEPYPFETVTGAVAQNGVPFPITVDPSTGNVYLLGYNTTGSNFTVSEISGSTNTVVTDFSPAPAPSISNYEELGIQVNPANGIIYVSGGNTFPSSSSHQSGVVLSINGSLTNHAIINSTTLRDGPYAEALNPAGTELYLSTLSCGTTCTSVAESINTTSYTVNPAINYTGGVPFHGSGYYGTRGIALDAVHGAVYLAAVGLQEIILANFTTGEMISETATEMAPVADTFDTYNGYFYVLNEFADSLSVINPGTNQTVTTLPLGGNYANGSNFYPKALTVDPLNGNIYIAAEETNSFTKGLANCTVEVVSGQSEKIVANITLGISTQPLTSDNSYNSCTSDGIAFDSVNKDVYIANPGINAIAVINTTTNELITNIMSTNSTNPQFQKVNEIAVDPDNGFVYVTESGYTFDSSTGKNSGYVSLINGSTNTVAGNVTIGNEVNTFSGCTSCDVTTFGVVFDKNLNEILVSSVDGGYSFNPFPTNFLNTLNGGTNKTITEINATTNSFVAAHSVCTVACDAGLGIILDPLSGLLYSDQLNVVSSIFTENSVVLSAINPSTWTFIGEVGFGTAGYDTQGLSTTFGPSDVGRIAIDPSNGEIFAPVMDSDSLSLFSTSTTAPASSSLSVLVDDPSGNPLASVTVSFFNQLQSPIGIGLTNSTGYTTPIQGLATGTIVYAEPSINYLPYYLPGTEAAFTLSAGSNNGIIQLERLQTGTIYGRVTFQNGTGAANALVTADVFTSVGCCFTFTATANSNGNYLISTIDIGNGEVSASLPNSTTSFRSPMVGITIPSSGVSANLTLSQLNPGYLSIEYYTQYAGQPSGQLQQLTANDGFFFGYQITDAFGNSYGPSTLEYPIPIIGYPGENLKVCINTYFRLSLPVDCGSTTIQNDGNASIVLSLYQAGTIIGNVVNGVTNEPVAGWGAYLYRVNSTGFEAIVGRPSSQNSSLNVDVWSPGQYELLIYGNGGLFGSLSVNLANGTVFEAGNIPVYPEGVFTGAYNTLTSAPSVTTPGGTIFLTAQFENSGTGAVAENSVLLLSIPQNTMLVPGSITLNGTQVTNAVPEGSEDAIPLGNLAEGNSGELDYSLQLLPTFNQTSLYPTAMMNYTLSGVNHQDVIGTADVSVPGVSLTAPSMIATLSTLISGQAPPGSIVTVFDNNTLLGQAMTPSGGYWQMNITIPRLGNESINNLVAQANTSLGSLLNSSTFIMVYDRFLPVIEEACMQDLYSSACWNPADGVATFPFVVHYEASGGWPIYFALQFSNPTQVTNVTVTVVGLGTVNATLGSDGLYRATITRISSWDVGPVYFNYSPQFFPSGNNTLPTSAPSKSQFLSTLLPPFNSGNYSLINSNSTGFDAFAKLSDGENLTFSENIIPNVVYSPTGHDLADAEVAGYQIYDFQYNASGSPPGLVDFTSSFFVPYSALPPSVVSYFDSGVGGAAAHSGVEVAIHGLHYGADALETIGVAQWAYYFSNDLIEAGSCLGVDSIQNLELGGAAAVIGEMGGIMAGAIASSVFGGPVAVLAVASIGILYGVAMEYFVKDPLEHQAEALVQMGEQTNCNKKPDSPNPSPTPGPDGGGANPDYYVLIDPSGYVYEAVTGNRLSNVTVSIFYRPNATAAWTLWDATAYGEQNQEVTNAQGGYGWYVPVGQWMVIYQKQGYVTTESPVLNVPPPIDDLDIGMVSLGPPSVVGVSAIASSSITVEFSKYVLVSNLSSSTIQVSGPQGPIEGTVEAINPQTSPSGTELTTEAQFIPSSPSSISAGSDYTVTISDSIQSYANVTMSENYVADVVSVASLSYSLSDQIPSGGNITLGDSVNATTRTTDPLATSATFAWTSPNGSLVEVDEIGVTSGIANDTFTPDQVGTWTLVANFTEDPRVVETQSINFVVVPVPIPQSPGNLNVISDSISFIETSVNATGSFSANSIGINGIQVFVSGDTYPPGTNAEVNAFIYASLPSVISNFTAQTGMQAIFYFDVRITNANGTATVCDTASQINDTDVMYYIPPNSSVWLEASNIYSASTDTLCGNIPVLQLHGTPIAISSSTLQTTSTTSVTSVSSSASSSPSVSTITSTTSTSTISSTTSTSSTTTGGGIHGFSFDLVLVGILAVLIIAGYLVSRRRFRSG